MRALAIVIALLVPVAASALTPEAREELRLERQVDRALNRCKADPGRRSVVLIDAEGEFVADNLVVTCVGRRKMRTRQ